LVIPRSCIPRNGRSGSSRCA